MNQCLHCGLSIKTQEEFCCIGCNTAYRLIKSLKLEKFYDYCKDSYNRSPSKAQAFENKLSYDEYINTNNDGTHSINLIVDGLECGACVWLIESTLRKREDILDARINLTYKTLKLSYKGEKDNIADIVDTTSKLGYRLIPFTPDALDQQDKEIRHHMLKAIVTSSFGFVAMMMILWGVWAGIADKSMQASEVWFFNILATLIAVPSILYSSRTFFVSAINALQHGRSNMDVAISIAIFLITIGSIYDAFRGESYVYYDASITLIFFLLVGRYLDYEFRSKARKHAKSLVLSQPKVMLVERDGVLSLIHISHAHIGDIAVVNTGEKFPADGLVIDGKSFVNNSLITGESKQIPIDVGSNVLSGSVNEGATVKIKITAIGENSNLGEIIKLIENAASKKNRYVLIADKVASIYTPAVLILSSITSIIWYFAIGIAASDALLYGLSVLIITCPCALGLAVPIVQVVANGTLFKDGIVIKNSEALEKLNSINAIIFDKTGTLTKANPSLINRAEIDDKDFEIISSLASYSSHPMCKAISQHHNIQFDSMPIETKGMGITAELKGVSIKLGNADFCSISTAEIQSIYSEMWFKKGNKSTRLLLDNQLKDDAETVVRTLKETTNTIEIISGDLDIPVKKCAETLGIAQYLYQMKPQDKLAHIQKIGESNKVLMIGDGINDAAALKAAFVSISPSNSSALTQVSSDIVIQGEKLEPILKILRIAKTSNNLMIQNFYIATAYNIVSIPIAMMGMVTPVIAAIVMSTSSILVVLNSLRIK